MCVLVTGGTGFIGGKLLARLVERGADRLSLLVRPGTDPRRYERFQRVGVRVEPVLMHDPGALDRLFDKARFDVVYHLAAIRGVRCLPWQAYLRTNVVATQLIAEHVARQGGRLVFCSSVGVYGTIPSQLPADERTPQVGDNPYHLSKILAERRLQEMVDRGLDVVIVRPTITYGTGDRGFPYALVRLVDQGLYVRCGRGPRIHLGDVSTLVEAFLRAAVLDLRSGAVYNVGDREPVALADLVQVISGRLRGRPYPRWKRLPRWIFELAGGLFGRLGIDAWRTRFQLMSRDWAYDVTRATRDLGLTPASTLDRFGQVVDWYLCRRV